MIGLQDLGNTLKDGLNLVGGALLDSLSGFGSSGKAPTDSIKGTDYSYLIIAAVTAYVIIS